MSVNRSWLVELQSYIDKFGIIYEGPKQPKEWPENHTHTFMVVRDIWATRYLKNAVSGTSIPSESSRPRKDEDVTRLVNGAHNYRRGWTNESTWRTLENTVMGIFREPVVCKTCRNEVHIIEHQAQPLDDDAFDKLKYKRRRRELCVGSCRSGNNSISIPSGDDEFDQPRIFSERCSTAITPHSADEFRGLKFSIPMEPDAIIGLHLPRRWRSVLGSCATDPSHYPVVGIDMLYPFLLIEAKRAVATDGFPAIEAQTAFPLRRLVLLQANLYKRAGTKYDPLVWFFANQGEDWRLYAGTLKEDKVRVYDLWHGTILSADGALQLLQIVDFLWSWARDVYRPQIRDSLHALTPELRAVSPCTEASFSRSQSVLFDDRLGSVYASQTDGLIQDNYTTRDLASEVWPTTNFGSHYTLPQYGTPSPNQELHDFPDAELRHSDVVRFSFRMLRVPGHIDYLQNPALKLEYGTAATISAALLESEMVVILEQHQIQDVKTFWLGEQTTTSNFDPPATELQREMVVCLFFRTFLKHTDWQIVRELTCVVWDLADLQQFGTTRQQTALQKAHETSRNINVEGALLGLLMMLREMTGRTSVSCALSDLTLRLSMVSATHPDSYPIQWSTDYSAHITDMEAALTSDLIRTANFYQTGAEVIALEQKMPAEEEMGRLLAIPKQRGQRGGILAQKPRSWPAESPAFCLFVLSDIAASDKEGLRELLSSMVGKQPVELIRVRDEEFQDQPVEFSRNERALIKSWIRSYRTPCQNSL